MTDESERSDGEGGRGMTAGSEGADGEGPPRDRAEPPPRGVTVVVITRDRWPDLQTSVPRHDMPVILVDNGSADGTPDLVRRSFPHVTVVELGENRGAVARNVGVELADTAYVAFADDDSWWAPGSLTCAVQLLDAHPRLAVLAGRMLVGEAACLDPVCTLMAESPLGREVDLPGPSVLGFVACGAVVRRTAYLQTGGFDPVIFFMGEEERLALDLAALGWGLAYVDQVVAHHHPPRPATRARERCARRATGCSPRCCAGQCPSWPRRREGQSAPGPAVVPESWRPSPDFPPPCGGGGPCRPTSRRRGAGSTEPQRQRSTTGFWARRPSSIPSAIMPIPSPRCSQLSATLSGTKLAEDCLSMTRP